MSFVFLVVQKGTKAPQAAGRIHGDFEKGFIMAEVYIVINIYTCVYILNHNYTHVRSNISTIKHFYVLCA